MECADFRVALGFERAIRRDRPYGGYPRLPSEGSPQMAFFDAAFQGDLPRLRELASGRDAKGMAWLADVCLVGAGPFQTAARLGKLDAVRCMVEELGFDVNAGSQAGVTALAAAAADGRMHVMSYLLDKGADPNKPANSGHYPLHHAAKHGRDEAARLLLSRGASIDVAYIGLTPLHFAAGYGMIGVMKVLLEHHADPNKVSEEGSTPLTEALHGTDSGVPESTSLKCVKLLVEAGADVNSANSETPLVIAKRYGLTDCVKYLSKVKHEKNTNLQLKSYAEKAIKRKDYHGASKFYTEAIELDPSDATLYSNRSLCYLQMTEADKAVRDANTCIKLRPEWIKGYYRKGAALLSLEDYKGASDAFMAGLQVDPENVEMEKAFMEAIEGIKKDHLAGKGSKPSD
ncbi:ankyrin-1-like [Triticum dicoccoides]|uniref:ankyrin-1-like n=1 Tax=Triticum dicoccoides TaxID=85692 RepID=UPI00188E78C1|nr:ankyrin-1-like [Triticum dicoccoides]